MIQIENTHVIHNNDNELRTNIGVYADKAGSGKTRAMISLIQANENPSDSIPETIGGNNLMCLSRVQSRIPSTSTLIIVPHNIIKFWEDEFRKVFTSSYDEVFVCKKTKSVEDLQILSKDIHMFPKIVLISNTMYSRFTPPIFKWNRVIIDDPQKITIHSLPNANFTWLVTSNPIDIVYPRRTYLRRMIPYVFSSNYSHIFESIIVKNYDVFVDESTNIPPFLESNIACKTQHYLRNVRKNIPKKALNKINNGATREAFDIIECLAVGSERDIVNDIIKKIENDNNDNNDVDLKNIRNRMETDCCPICLENPKTLKAITHCCKNVFCLDCLLMSAHTSTCQKCPMCNQKNCDEKLNIITSDEELYLRPIKKQKKTKRLNKTQTMLYHVRGMIDHIGDSSDRLIIFVNEDTYAHIETHMTKMNFTFAFLERHRDLEFERFKNGTHKVLVLTEKCTGYGYDLSFVTNILFYNQNMSLRDEIIGRAQRIGRKKQLQVHNLVYDDDDE